MYSLFVTHAASERTDGVFTIERGRFLEYTDDGIRGQIGSLSVEAGECLKSWPCLLMQEGRGNEAARVVRVVRIEATAREVRATIEPIGGIPSLANDELWKAKDTLDIENFEFNRNHWAVKDRDLAAPLSLVHRAFASIADAFPNAMPLPFPSRTELLRARDVMASWGHTELDDFLLEAGIPALRADKGLGNRRNRANAIVTFSLEHPNDLTADNSLLSALVMRRTAQQKGVSSGSPRLPADEAIRMLEDGPVPSEVRSPNRVFVVHGQNESARQRLVSFLGEVGLEPIVLHEQPNMGRHLLTKFIEEAALVTFAVVLMTNDDVGGPRGTSDLKPRARQNVILELGYFIAYLGQPKVCALVTPGLETPSDFDGIVYIRMDDAGAWTRELKRELIAAKMPVLEHVAAEQAVERESGQSASASDSAPALREI